MLVVCAIILAYAPQKSKRFRIFCDDKQAFSIARICFRERKLAQIAFGTVRVDGRIFSGSPDGYNIADVAVTADARGQMGYKIIGIADDEKVFPSR